MNRLSDFGLGTLFVAAWFWPDLRLLPKTIFVMTGRDIRHDHRDILSDRRAIHDDRTNLHSDYQTLRQDRTTLRNDVKNGASADQITADRQAVHSEFKDIRDDERALASRSEGSVARR